MDVKDNVVTELKKFQKQSFDMETILNTASELKYSNQIKQFMALQLLNPTDGFISYIIGEVYSGRKTQNVIDKFRDIVKKSLNHFVNELMSDRIKTVIENQSASAEPPKTPEPVEIELDAIRVQTTNEELEGYFIIKSLLREFIQSDRITHKDTESYFGILLDNNTWKWICRLQLNGLQKYLIIPDGNKKQNKYLIKDIDDIYNLKKELTDSLKRFI